MFKATARLYDKTRKVMAEHTGLGGTVILASEAGITKLLDEVPPGRLRLIEWNLIETVVTRVEEWARALARPAGWRNRERRMTADREPS